MPQFKKKNVKRHKPVQVREKKNYTPFPPPQQPSKVRKDDGTYFTQLVLSRFDPSSLVSLQVDLQLESGEYFLNEQQRKLKKSQEKQAR